MEKKERRSNIELLRMLSMLGVIVLHYNNTEIGGGLLYAQGVNRGILIVLESIFICAVNLYLLISGYFLCSRNDRKLNKPLELLAQVMLFQLGFYLLRLVLGQESFGVKGLLGSLVPNNYFVILYIVCFVLSPYLNLLLENLGKKQSRRLLLLLLILFSVWDTLVNLMEELTHRGWQGLSTIGIQGGQNGYTIVNFMLMYMVGAYLKLYFEKEYRYKTILAAFVGNLIIISGWAAWNDVRGIIGGSAWAYCNPFVIAEAVILFLLFLKLPVKNSRFINGLAKGSFTVYLLHTAFLQYIGIPKAVEASPVLLFLHVLAAAVGIYLICWLCYFIYEKITRPIWNQVEKRWKMELKTELFSPKQGS